MLHLVRVIAVGLATALVGCVVMPERQQHALVPQGDGLVAEVSMRCDESTSASRVQDGALDPSAIRLAAWNLHKEVDPGWQSESRTN
jgi:hypothetical protein